jgi:hypothetical protein
MNANDAKRIANKFENEPTDTIVSCKVKIVRAALYGYKETWCDRWLPQGDIETLRKDGFKVKKDMRIVEYDGDHFYGEWDFVQVVDWTNPPKQSWFRWKKIP